MLCISKLCVIIEQNSRQSCVVFFYFKQNMSVLKKTVCIVIMDQHICLYTCVCVCVRVCVFIIDVWTCTCFVGVCFDHKYYKQLILMHCPDLFLTCLYSHCGNNIDLQPNKATPSHGSALNGPLRHTSLKLYWIVGKWNYLGDQINLKPLLVTELPRRDMLPCLWRVANVLGLPGGGWRI